MALVTVPARQDREAVITEAMRVFGELGVTAEDLRQWTPWCAALGELADAMDAAANPEKAADRSVRAPRSA